MAHLVYKVPTEQQILKKERRLKQKFYNKFSESSLLKRLLWAWKNPKINARCKKIPSAFTSVEIRMLAGGGGGAGGSSTFYSMKNGCGGAGEVVQTVYF